MRSASIGPECATEVARVAGFAARVGSKHGRQRASYVPVAPSSSRSSLATRRCVWLAGLPHTMQMAWVLVTYSAIAISTGIGSNGRPR